MSSRALSRNRVRRVVLAIRWLALFVCAFGLGIFYAATNYQQIHGLIATIQLSLQLGNKTSTGNWFAARFNQFGLLHYDPARAQNGLYFIWRGARPIGASRGHEWP